MFLLSGSKIELFDCLWDEYTKIGVNRCSTYEQLVSAGFPNKHFSHNVKVKQF